MKKILVLSFLFLFSGCQVPFATPGDGQNPLSELLDNNGSDYVAEMTTDADGFVRFPGEPTRETKDYYIIEDICGQFTMAFMEGVTDRKIINADNPNEDIAGIYACHYYFDGNASDIASLYLVLNYLDIDNQKKGIELLDGTVTESNEIPMENVVAYKENGDIYAIYFVLGPNKFIRLDRSSNTAVSDDEMMAIAINIGQKIKNYK